MDLVLEMTDRHSVIFQLMLAAMIASGVSLLVDKKSFYDNLKHQYMHELRHMTPPKKVVRVTEGTWCVNKYLAPACEW